MFRLVAAGLTLVSLTAPMYVGCSQAFFVDVLNSSQDGSVAAAIFQTSCRVGFAIGLAIATLIQTNVEKRELAAGVGEREALAAGVRGGFWFCTASAAAIKSAPCTRLIRQVPLLFCLVCGDGKS